MLSALCLLSSGCASVLVTSLHNQNIQQKARALQFRADNTSAAFMIDLLDLQGYLGAWQEHPWAMGFATLADVGSAVGIGVAISESQSGPSKSTPAASTPGAPGTVYDLRSGEGGDITIININGDANTTGDGNGNSQLEH
jgi:hypothetical protein